MCDFYCIIIIIIIIIIITIKIIINRIIIIMTTILIMTIVIWPFYQRKKDFPKQEDLYGKKTLFPPVTLT